MNVASKKNCRKVAWRATLAVAFYRNKPISLSKMDLYHSCTQPFCQLIKYVHVVFLKVPEVLLWAVNYVELGGLHYFITVWTLFQAHKLGLISSPSQPLPTSVKGRGKAGTGSTKPRQLLVIGVQDKDQMVSFFEVLIGERSERDTIRDNKRKSEIYFNKYIYIWYVPDTLVARARYVMWEELSVKPFLKHSNHWKPTLKMF